MLASARLDRVARHLELEHCRRGRLASVASVAARWWEEGSSFGFLQEDQAVLAPSLVSLRVRGGP
jgi:hypothetical protein